MRGIVLLLFRGKRSLGLLLAPSVPVEVLSSLTSQHMAGIILQCALSSAFLTYVDVASLTLLQGNIPAVAKIAYGRRLAVLYPVLMYSHLSCRSA